MHQGVIFEMTCFADFLKRLQALPEGSSSVLENSLVYATSEVSSGLLHEHVEFPVLFAGKAGGRLRGDQHVRASGDNYTKALVTVVRAMGMAVDGISKDEGRATDAIEALFA